MTKIVPVSPKYAGRLIFPPGPINGVHFKMVKTHDVDYWIARPELSGRVIEFHLAGDSLPSMPNLEHARFIAEDFPKFEQLVRDYLDWEIEQVDEEDVKAEYRQLKIESISLWWEKRPTSGMIYFKEVSPYFLWRCDYIECQPCHLGADT